MNNKWLSGFIAFILLFISSVAVARAYNDGQDRRVRIHNQSGVTVTRLYGSNTASSSWEEDILGDDVLSPGQSIRVNFDDGTGACYFDIKVVFMNGASATKPHFNVCTNSNLYID